LPDILEFRQIVDIPCGLAEWPATGSPGFIMGGRFHVLLRLNPRGNCAKYEYRQFIKGTCTAQRGHFNGPVSLTNWQADGPELDRSSVFQIPGGLDGATFHEDGMIVNGIVSRMGYRTAPALMAQGIEDRYLPNQTTGCEYHAMDTYGLRDTTRVVGTRFRLHFWFEGRVIDRQSHDRVVSRLNWEVQGDDIVTT
jgi:hypothetical protein